MRAASWVGVVALAVLASGGILALLPAGTAESPPAIGDPAVGRWPGHADAPAGPFWLAEAEHQQWDEKHGTRSCPVPHRARRVTR